MSPLTCSSFSHLPWMSPPLGGLPWPLHPDLPCYLLTIFLWHLPDSVSIVAYCVCCGHCEVNYTRATPGLLCSLPSTPCLARVNTPISSPLWVPPRQWLGHTRPGSSPLHSAWYAGEDECLLNKHRHKKQSQNYTLKECDVPDGDLWQSYRKGSLFLCEWPDSFTYYCRKVIVLAG